jgi:hypothetical protein
MISFLVVGAGYAPGSEPGSVADVRENWAGCCQPAGIRRANSSAAMIAA